MSYARAGSTPAAGTKLMSITNRRCPQSPAIRGFFMPGRLFCGVFLSVVWGLAASRESIGICFQRVALP